MYENYKQTSEFATIEVIAETIRRELGEEIEACPGCREPEQAEPLNRVFRAIVRRLLEPIAAPDHDLTKLVTWALQRIGHKRLVAGGLNEDQIKTIFELEAGTPDDWLVFLILVPWQEVLFWLHDGEPPMR